MFNCSCIKKGFKETGSRECYGNLRKDNTGICPKKKLSPNQLRQEDNTEVWSVKSEVLMSWTTNDKPKSLEACVHFFPEMVETRVDYGPKGGGKSIIFLGDLCRSSQDILF
jgi:hypothetical protein